MVGDHMLSVNGVDVTKATPTSIQKLLQKAKIVKMKVVQIPEAHAAILAAIAAGGQSTARQTTRSEANAALGRKLTAQAKQVGQRVASTRPARGQLVVRSPPARSPPARHQHVARTRSAAYSACCECTASTSFARSPHAVSSVLRMLRVHRQLVIST